LISSVYARHAGGLSQVATVLSELAERIDPEKLAAAARSHRSPGRNGSDTCWSILAPPQKLRHSKEYVRERAKQSTALLPKARRARSRCNKGWKLYINA
jgi:hypothetical protein